ncbi:hypothetical protein V6N11_054022 [Hibiscus sabdariffa]|uniref:Integrase catalytic domain-containing protein n=1 Tax=Hibiscus sabdariffa TaxID=183260 RepID=A0ABR2S3J3_9ROSI
MLDLIVIVSSSCEQRPKSFVKFLEEDDIVTQYTISGSPNTNGIPEGCNRTFKDICYVCGSFSDDATFSNSDSNCLQASLHEDHLQKNVAAAGVVFTVLKHARRRSSNPKTADELEPPRRFVQSSLKVTQPPLQ